MNPKLTAIGLGPGDPELITIKGLRAIERADYIFVPRSQSGGESQALRIARPWLSPLQRVITLPLPMTHNPDLLVPAWQAAAEMIAQGLLGSAGIEAVPPNPPEGGMEGELQKQGVYLLLGDPLLYGTFIYIWQALKRQAPRIDVEIVPGITSFSAAAACTETILSTTNDRIAILPASYETDWAVLDDLLSRFDTIILLKAGPAFPQVLAALESLGLVEYCIYAEQVGLPGERLLKGAAIRSLPPEKQAYLSLLIVRKT